MLTQPPLSVVGMPQHPSVAAGIPPAPQSLKEAAR